MTTYLTATLAAARNDELHRRGVRPLPLFALDAIRSSRRSTAIKEYLVGQVSQAHQHVVRRHRLSPRET
jgi:hypothetical protein